MTKRKPSPNLGGARPNSGRKPLDPEGSVNFSVRVPRSWAVALRERGLRPAVREAIRELLGKDGGA